MYDFELSSSQVMDWGDRFGSIIGGADKQVSVAFTIKPESIGGVDMTVLAKYDGANDLRQMEWAIVQVTGKVFVTFVGDGAAAKFAQVQFDTTPLVAGTTYRIVIVYDGSIDTSAVNRFSCWINGTAQAKTLRASGGVFPFDIPATGTAPWAVGARKRSTAGGDNFYDGNVSEPALWSGLLVTANAVAYHKGYDPEMIRPDILEWCPHLVRGTHDPRSGATATVSASAPVVGGHPRVNRLRRSLIHAGV